MFNPSFIPSVCSEISLKFLATSFELNLRFLADILRIYSLSRFSIISLFLYQSSIHLSISSTYPSISHFPRTFGPNKLDVDHLLHATHVTFEVSDAFIGFFIDLIKREKNDPNEVIDEFNKAHHYICT